MTLKQINDKRAEIAQGWKDVKKMQAINSSWTIIIAWTEELLKKERSLKSAGFWF